MPRFQQSRNRLKSKSTESSPERAFNYALRLLAGRDYSAARIRKKLIEREFTVEDTDAAVMRLEEDGWINDRRFAERFVEYALSSGKYYGVRLRQELRRREIPADIVDRAVQHTYADHDQSAAIRDILKKRYAGFSFSTSDEKEKRRIMGYLQRRGYGFSSIMQVLRESSAAADD